MFRCRCFVLSVLLLGFRGWRVVVIQQFGVVGVVVGVVARDVLLVLLLLLLFLVMLVLLLFLVMLVLACLVFVRDVVIYCWRVVVFAICCCCFDFVLAEVRGAAMESMRTRENSNSPLWLVTPSTNPDHHIFPPVSRLP